MRHIFSFVIFSSTLFATYQQILSSMRTCFSQVRRFFRSQLGDKETFQFWEDDWSGHGRLDRIFPHLYALSTDPGVLVRRAWNDAWVPPLPEALPDQRVAELISLQALLAGCRLSEAAHDAWVWSDPSFTTWAAYRLFRDQQDSEDPFILQRCCLVWKRRPPMKIKVFAWLLLRRCLMTRSLLQRMVPDVPAECPLWARVVEDCQHLFFVCPFAQAVWQAAGINRLMVTSEEAFWQSLGGGTFRHEAEGQTIFATLWSLWIHRNEVIFRGCTPSVDAIQHNTRGFASFWYRGGLGPSTIGPL